MTQTFSESGFCVYARAFGIRKKEDRHINQTFALRSIVSKTACADSENAMTISDNVTQLAEISTVKDRNGNFSDANPDPRQAAAKIAKPTRGADQRILDSFPKG